MSSFNASDKIAEPLQAQNLHESRYIDFPKAADDATRDGEPVLNKYSTFLTREHDFPGAKVSFPGFPTLSFPSLPCLSSRQISRLVPIGPGHAEINLRMFLGYAICGWCS